MTANILFLSKFDSPFIAQLPKKSHITSFIKASGRIILIYILISCKMFVIKAI